MKHCLKLGFIHGLVPFCQKLTEVFRTRSQADGRGAGKSLLRRTDRQDSEYCEKPTASRSSGARLSSTTAIRLQSPLRLFPDDVGRCTNHPGFRPRGYRPDLVKTWLSESSAFRQIQVNNCDRLFRQDADTSQTPFCKVLIIRQRAPSCQPYFSTSYSAPAGYEPGGREFESLRARQKTWGPIRVPIFFARRDRTMSPAGRLFEPRSPEGDDAPTEGRPSLRARSSNRGQARGSYPYSISAPNEPRWHFHNVRPSIA